MTLPHDLHSSEQIDEDALYNTYYKNLPQQIVISMNYLHTTVNWTITLLVGTVVTLFIRSDLSPEAATSVLSVLIVVTSHFFIRAGKAYISLMQWSTIDRLITTSFYTRDVGPASRAIRLYHTEWASPVTKWTVTYKLLFELGFIYFYSAIYGVLLYSIGNKSVPAGLIVLFAACHIISALEIWLGLFRSPYMRLVLPLPEAERYR